MYISTALAEMIVYFMRTFIKKWTRLHIHGAVWYGVIRCSIEHVYVYLPASLRHPSPCRSTLLYISLTRSRISHTCHCSCDLHSEYPCSRRHADAESDLNGKWKWNKISNMPKASFQAKPYEGWAYSQYSEPFTVWTMWSLCICSNSRVMLRM